MSAPLPPVPTPAPTPQSPPMSWWVTTIAGALIPLMLAIGVYVPQPYGGILLAIAGALGTALGVSHSGNITPPASPPLPPPPVA